MPDVAIPLDAKWFTNVGETALTRAAEAMENCYVAENGGIMRFPPLRDFATLPTQEGAKVFLSDWRDSLMASTSRGRLFTITRSAVVSDVTGVPLSGGKRTIFAETDDELLTAAGGPILKFSGVSTAKLSDDAPETTHIGYIDGYTIGTEPGSGRFFHSSPGLSGTWNALDVFTAEGKPDNLTGLHVSDYRELLLFGEKSIEQFERLSNGDRPFYRRWSSGETVGAPYTVISVDQGVWLVNSRREFVRLSGQNGQPRSDDIQRDLSKIDDISEAWADYITLGGQKFIVLQFPNARNTHGSTGITLLHDIRTNRWSALYGWDSGVGRPVRWQGWSLRRLWGRVFVGGEGRIHELVADRFEGPHDGQRMLWRSGHLEARALAGTNAMRIDDLRIRMTRGRTTQYDIRPRVTLRVRRDQGAWSRWVERDIGGPGETFPHVRFGGFGKFESAQIEIMMSDSGPFEGVTLHASLTPLSA